METEHPCYEVWVRKGTTSYGARVKATTDLDLVSVHRAQGKRKSSAKPRTASDTEVDLKTGNTWTPFGGSWNVQPGESCELRFVVVPKGGKAEITVEVGGQGFTFRCTSGDEAVTAKFRLSVR